MEWEALSNDVETVELWCGSFGEEGNEESVISSISEWEDADLGDFFLPKACLKELRNWKKNQEHNSRHIIKNGTRQKELQNKNFNMQILQLIKAILMYILIQVKKNKKAFFPWLWD